MEYHGYVLHISPNHSTLAIHSYPTYFQTGVGHSQVWCRLAMEPDSLINSLSFQAFVQSAVVVVRPCPGSRQVMTVIESLLGEACKPAQSQWVPRSHLRRLFKAREWPSPKCISSNADRIVSQTITGAPFSTDTQEESYLDLSWPPSDPEKNNRVLERKLQSKQPRFGESSRVPIPWQCHTVVTPGPIGLLPMGNHRTDDVTVIASTPSSWHPRKLGHRSENLC